MTTPLAPPHSFAPNYRARRGIFLALALLSSVFATLILGVILGANGLTWLEIGMIIAFVLTLQFNVIGFWNAMIGAVILLGAKDPVRTILPLARAKSAPGILKGRTALVMPVFNEDTAMVFRNLQAIDAGLAASANADRFEIFILSDSQVPAIVAAEEEQFAAWCDAHGTPERLHYRRRLDNSEQKAGNIWDFVQTRGDDFDYMLVLDADSIMSAKTIEWLVRIMDADPKLGILQTLTAGLPSASLFARVLQFGMRHVMRAFTVGGAWWQGPNGPYWGHNALIRLDAFKRHCALPQLPGEAPLGGRVLSHDQVEAALIQAAGYEVRVLPEECESYEDTPPSLADYIKRDLRWCQGNMQYFQLLRWPGLKPMGRLQLLLAMMNYLTAPCWIIFIVLGLSQAVMASMGYTPDAMIGFIGLDTSGALGIDIGVAGLALLGAILTMNFAPKLVGYVAVMGDAKARSLYGGGFRLTLSMLIEFVFSLFLAPIIAVAQTVFLFRLFVFKRAIVWDAQARGHNRVSFFEAVLRMWPQLVFGLTVGFVVGLTAPSILPWVSPIIIGCVLAAPLTWFTSLEWAGRFVRRLRLCAIPEENKHVPVLGLAGYGATPEGVPAAASGAVLAPSPAATS
ncbi:MAG: glucans biosynthesis glucosyltransferase MdoH [Pseudomonadota bacterium]